MDQQQDARAAFEREIAILARQRIKVGRSFAEMTPGGTSLRVRTEPNNSSPETGPCQTI